MAWRNEPASMEYDDDEILDRLMPDAEPLTHPPGLIITLDCDDLEKAAGASGSPGDILRFSAMGDVASVFRGEDGSRIELELCEFAGEDGKFFDLGRPAYLCLCSSELDKMDLDDDAERGDMIHLIGEARLMSTHDSAFGRCASLQIERLTYEDESTESREG
jgi:hypothetical protein